MKYNNKKTDQKGRLMIELLAGLALIGMLTPVIFMKTIERNQEVEDAAIASQMRSLRNSVVNIIANNFEQLTEGGVLGAEFDDDGNMVADTGIVIAPLAQGVQEDNIVLDLSEEYFRKYLPEGFQNTTKALGDEFKVGINRKRTTLQAGREKLTLSAIVVGGRTNKEELTDRRSARIASMIGLDGGFIRSTAFSNALQVDKNIAVSGSGLWELDTSDYIDDLGQGRIVVSTTVPEATATTEDGGNYLWRIYVDGCPECNRMETDLNMTLDVTPRKIDRISKITSWRAYENQFEGYNTGSMSANIGLAVPGTTGEQGLDRYTIDLEGGTSLMADVALGNMGGHVLSDIMPRLSLKKIARNIVSGNFVGAPGYNNSGSAQPETERIDRKCPVGYAPAIYIAPSVLASTVETPGSTVRATVNRSDSGGETTGWTVSIIGPAGTKANAYVYCNFIPDAFKNLNPQD